VAVWITSLALDGRGAGGAAAATIGVVEDGFLRCRMPFPPVTSSCFVNAAIWALASMSWASAEEVEVGAGTALL
jgi:hypothetical protein